MPHLSFVFTIVISLLFVPLASAKDKSVDFESPLTGLYTCAEISDNMARLACYDQVAGKLKTAEENKELVAIDSKAAKKIKREAFGFNIPSLPKLGLPKIGSGEKIDALVADVESVKNIRRKYVITLKNGQVWKETGGYLNYVPKGNLTATIKPKSMGSYMISLSNGKTTTRGLRVRRTK